MLFLVAFRRVDFHTGARRRTSSRSPTSSRGGASSSPPWPARCARRRTGRVSRVLLLFLALCRDPGARRTTSMPQPSAGPRREVAYASPLRHRAGSSRVPRRPFEDYRATRHRRRRGTSSASSSGRSTARRRRPRTAGCTERATRYVFRRPFQVPPDAIDATRYEKRRRNAATRRSRPSRPR